MELSRLASGGKLAVTFLLISILLGLIFAQIGVRYTLANRDGEPGITIADVRLYFQGDPTRCRLETMINGRMRDKFASPDEKQAVEDWIADGAPREDYDSTVAPIFQTRCIRCHGPAGEKATSPLTTFEEVSRFIESSDTGISYETLASISFFHLVAMICLAALAAGLFYITRFKGGWKEVLIVVPFVAAAINVLSWWSAKQSDASLHIIAAGTILYAASIAIMVFLTLVDLWILSEQEQQEP